MGSHVIFWYDWPIKPQNLCPWLVKPSQSNFNLRSPDCYLVRSYLITTVENGNFCLLSVVKTCKTCLRKGKGVQKDQKCAYVIYQWSPSDVSGNSVEEWSEAGTCHFNQLSEWEIYDLTYLFFFILKYYHICLSQVYQKRTPVRDLTRNCCIKLAFLQ